MPKEGIKMNPVVRVTRSRCRRIESIDSDNSERSNTPSVSDLDSKKSETPPLLTKQVNSPEENLRNIIDTPTKRITRRTQSEIKLLDAVNSPSRRRTRRAGSVLLDENSKDVISHDEETKSPSPSATNQQQLQQTPVPGRRITRRSSILLNESCELTPVLISSPSRRTRRRNSMNSTEEQDEVITMKIQKNTLLDTCVPEEDVENDNLSTVEKQDQNNDNANTLFPALCTRSRSKSPNVINLDTINEENETPQKNNFNVESKEASQNNYEKELVTNESKVEKDNDKINHNQDESIKIVSEKNKNEGEFTERSENDLVVLKIDEISVDKIENENINESNSNKSNNKIEKGKISKSFNEKIQTDEIILENTSKINKLNLSGGNILHKLNKISEFNNNSKLNDSIQPMEVDETISEVEVFFSKKKDKESNELLDMETNIFSKSNNQNLEKLSDNFNETTKLNDSKHSETENNNSIIENEKTVDEIAQNDKSDKENIEINNKTATPTTTTVAQAILKSKYNDGIENLITPFKKRMSSELTASSTPIVTNESIDEKQNCSITKEVSHNKEDEIKKLETLVEYEENSLNKIDNNSSSKKRQNVIILDLTVINDKSSKFPKTPIPSKTRSRIIDDDDSIDNDKSSSSTKESENKSLNETDLSVSSSKIRGILNLSESSSLSLLNNSKNNKEKDENNLKSRCNDFAKSWSQSIKGTADTTIDSFGLKKNISNNDSKDHDTSNKSDTQKSFKKKYIEESEDEEEEEEEESKEKNEFIDDEAEEVSDSDSLDSEEREYLKQNEVPERGESLGSQDTDNDRSDGDNEEIDEEIASFIVSDEEEVENEEDMGEEEEEGEEAKMSVDEDDDNDESKSGNVNRKKEFEKKRRSRQIISSSEDEEEDVKDETKQKSTTENQNEEEKEKILVVTGILENKLDNEAENNDKNEESAILKNNYDEPATQKSSEELNTINNDDLSETVEGELLMSVNVLETTTDHKSSLDENLINNDQINSNKKDKISLDKSIVTSTVTSEINIEKQIFPIKKTRQSLPARRMSLHLPQNYRETKSEEKEIRIASDNKKISKKLNDKHDEDQTGSVKNKDSESSQNENDIHQSLPISLNDYSKIIEKPSNANVEDSCRNSNDISFLNLKYIFEKRSVEDNVNSNGSDSDSVDNADDKNQSDKIENNDNAENSCNDDNANHDHDDDSDSGNNVDKNVDGDDDKADNNDDGDNNDNSGDNENENSSDENIDENETEIHHDLQDSKDNKTNTSQEESGGNDDFITRIMKRCNEVLEQTKNEVKIPNKNKSKTNKNKKLKQQKKEIEEKDQKETPKSLKPEKQVEKALKFSEKLLQKKIKNSKPMSSEEENIKTPSPKKIVNVITNKSQLNKEKNTNKKSIKTSPLKKSIKDDVIIKQGKRKISDVSIEEPKDEVKKKKRNITAIIKNPSGLIYEEPLPSSSKNNKIKISEFSWGIVKEESISNETSSNGFKETPLTPKSHKFKIDEYHKKSENSKVGKNKNKKETMKDYSWGTVHEEPLQIKPINISKSIGHKLNKAMSAGQIEPPTLNKNKNKKNKKIISEPTTVPPKPSWVKNSKELQSSSSVGSLIRIPIGRSTDDDTGTDFFLQPLTGKKRKRQAIDTISETALQFKKKTSSNDKIPRETSKQLLQKKDKERFNYY